MGVMAGTLDLIQRGYVGCDIRDGVLVFNPRLPDRLDGLSFPMQFRGTPLTSRSRPRASDASRSRPRASCGRSGSPSATTSVSYAPAINTRLRSRARERS